MGRQYADSLEAGVSIRAAEGCYEADVRSQGICLRAKSAELNTAARFTDYSTTEAVWTWKFGLNWQMTDDLRFRFTRSRDIRARI